MTKDIETLIADLDSVNWIQAATAIYRKARVLALSPNKMGCSRPGGYRKLR